MRIDRKSRIIVRVIKIVSTYSGPLAFINDEEKGFDYIYCAFDKNRYCTPKCAACETDEGVVKCRRGCEIGHMRKEFDIQYVKDT